MDQNQRRARIINMRKGQPLPHIRPPRDGKTTTAYFIESRPAPSQPWQQSKTASWTSKADALDWLTVRRQQQPNWEHRLMERTTTVTEQPATEA